MFSLGTILAASAGSTTIPSFPFSLYTPQQHTQFTFITDTKAMACNVINHKWIAFVGNLVVLECDRLLAFRDRLDRG